jgi:7,8-dihydro-6-hydroxymethylpterin dimethyltransferase
MKLREHTFLGTTQSLCPACMKVIPAKIVVREGRVYFQKRCPEHGAREDFVCSDARHYDRLEYNVPGKVPPVMAVEPERGCPLDCGLCTDHEQHTCIGLVEITSSCNLKCPMCYAESGPGGEHLPFEQVKRAIDRLVHVEGGAEVLQLSGGEPTIHPEIDRVLEYAASQRIDLLMINSNGLRFATDDRLLDLVTRHKQRLEIYFQLDALTDEATRKLRGGALVEEKLRALERLGSRGIRVILVSTLHPGVNEGEIGALVRFAVERPFVTGVSFQPATYTGRHVLPEDLERRITFPDVVKAIAEQTDGMFREDDFLPLPCAHPNCHTLTYAYRKAGTVIPLTRFIDARQHVDLLANGITYTRPRARQLVQDYLKKAGCADGCSSPAEYLAGVARARASSGLSDDAAEFFAAAIEERLSPADVFRITITSFLDAYNFDVRRVMKCCIHHVLPSGHVVPFCAYNTLYRPGHVALPPLRDAVEPTSLVTLRTPGKG